MCVRALCLVVMVSVDLNYLLLGQSLLSFFSFFRLLFLRTALADLSQDYYKNLTYKALECQLHELDQTLIAS